MEKKQNYVTWIQTACFTVYIKTEDTNAGIAKNVETRFDNYELDISLPKEKNKKVIGLMKDDLDEKIMTELAALKPKIIQLFGRQQQ